MTLITMPKEVGNTKEMNRLEGFAKKSKEADSKGWRESSAASELFFPLKEAISLPKKMFLYNRVALAGGLDSNIGSFMKQCKTTRILLLSTIFLLLFFTAACSDDGVIYIDNYLVKDTTQYRLENTSWKLAYFVDVENGTKREPIIASLPYPLPSYTIYFCDTIDLYFCENATPLKGMADVNVIYGCYVVDYTASSIKTYNVWNTAVYVPPESDEDNYVYSICNATTFEITKNQLKLFYNDKKNYLLFNKIAGGDDV